MREVDRRGKYSRRIFLQGAATAVPVVAVAASAGIGQAETGDGWRLTLGGDGQPGRAPVVLRRADLLRLAQHTASLPIACVEGWSTDDQVWTGVRLRDLAVAAGVDELDQPPGRRPGLVDVGEAAEVEAQRRGFGADQVFGRLRSRDRHSARPAPGRR